MVGIDAVLPGEDPSGRIEYPHQFQLISLILTVKSFSFSVSEVNFVTGRACNSSGKLMYCYELKPCKTRVFLYTYEPILDIIVGTPKVTTDYTTQESSVSTTATAEMVPPTIEKHNMPSEYHTVVLQQVIISCTTDTTNTMVDYGNISITSSYSVTVTENTVGTDITTSNDALKVAIGIIIAIATLLTTVLVLIAVVIFARKSTKQKRDHDSPYSVLRRGTIRQLQPPVDNNPSGMYDQIKLSPLTGQAEFDCNAETGNTSSNIMQRQQNTANHGIERNQLKIASSPKTSDKHNDNTEHATYAVVNKKKKNKLSQKAEVHDNCESTTQKNANGQASLEDLYAAVKKKTKGRAAKEDDNAPPVPPHTVEELYTAVSKIPKVRAATKEEEAPPIPPHTVEELYTAVNKTPKGNGADDEEEAPSIPPHTDEDMCH